MRGLFTVAVLATALLHAADDIKIPLEGGSLIIAPQFMRINEYGDFVPELCFGSA